MLISFIEDKEVYCVFDFGVDSYILKIISVSDIVDVVCKMYEGELVFELEVLVKMCNCMKKCVEFYEMLIEREMEILLFIVKGYFN